MADEVLTPQKLLDASADCETIEIVTNGDDQTDVTSRLGQTMPTISKALRIILQMGIDYYKTEAELLASTPIAGTKAGKALDTKKLFLWENGAWLDTGLSELDLAKVDASTKANTAESNAKSYVNSRIGVSVSHSIFPIVVDKKDKSPLWINKGRLAFTELESETAKRVKPQFGLSDITSNRFIPVVATIGGKSPLWIQDGMLNFADMHQDAVNKVKLKLGAIGGTSNNTTGAAYPIVSDSTSLRQWKAKASKLKSGIDQQLRIIMTGDSWAEHKTITNELLTLLRAEFGESGSGWINLGAENNQLDNISVARAGSWSYADLNLAASFPNGSSPDGFVLTSTAAANTVTVSNVMKGDQLTVFFGKTDGSFKYSVNGGTETTVTALASGASLQSAVIPISATSEIVFTTVSGTVVLYGMHLRKSTGSGVEVTKLGNGGSTGQDFLKISPTAQTNFASYLKPDVVVIILGTNDYRYGHSVENYKAGISAIIDGYRTNNSNCGVILIAPAISNATASIPLSNYRDAVYELAISKKCEFYNMHDDWADFASENANSQWNDAYHVSKSGAYRIARKLLKKFLEL